MTSWAPALLSLVLFAGCTVERADVRRPPAARAVVSAEDSANVRGVLLTFTSQLVRGDVMGLERIFDPAAVVFESGRTARGWGDYRDRLLRPELEALHDRRFELEELGMRIVGSVAWVHFSYRRKRASEAGPVSETGFGTIVMERRGGLWLITHLHLTGTAEPADSR